MTSTPSTRSSTPLPPASSTTRHIKVLLLHGYTQNGPLFHNKTRALTKFIEKTLAKQHNIHVTFDAPTAPFRLRLQDIPGTDVSQLQGAEGGDEDETLEAYAWWGRNESYSGMDKCWSFLNDYLQEHGPYAGVIGFSQGACLAGMLAAALEPNRQRPPQFTLSHPPLEFVLSYCGFKATPADLQFLYEPKITTPILHFIGSLDTIMEEWRPLALVDACEGARDKGRVIYHPGGHYVVVQKQFLNIVAKFLEEVWRENVETQNANGDGKAKDEGRAEDMDLPF